MQRALAPPGSTDALRLFVYVMEPPIGLVVIDYQRIIYTRAGLDYRSTSDEILVQVVTVAPDYLRATRPDHEYEETRWMESECFDRVSRATLYP